MGRASPLVLCWSIVLACGAGALTLAACDDGSPSATHEDRCPSGEEAGLRLQLRDAGGHVPERYVVIVALGGGEQQGGHAQPEEEPLLTVVCDGGVAGAAAASGAGAGAATEAGAARAATPTLSCHGEGAELHGPRPRSV
ncbi:MAG: hypothetical protein FJ125_07370, partial [Deltaproteobacteria bacterium]|nr:hypothetical protein [Deltaproteobacteria bacterium]